MNRELETFGYSIAHDLRAPLRAINGIIASAYGPGFDEEGRRLLTVVQSETRRMDQLIASLLTLSRIGRSSINPVALDMAGLVRSAFATAVEARPEGDIEFHIGQLPPASGDAALLRQVWENLLSNAVKFSARTAGAVIRVEGELRRSEAVYSVHDHGAGFDMHYADKLFGVFQRLHPAQEFEGNGIGLALVQRIVVMHGGRVWAAGEVGKGAVFYFSLPR
jgi:light-regulated signal transduction histidine kinase (bacteriophytochrome)